MKRFLSLLIAVALAAPLATPVMAQEEGPGAAKGAQVDTTGKGYTAAFVIEPSTRRVLFAENADVPLPTASMAKMMTCLIAMEEISGGRLKLTDTMITSARASKMGGSQIYAKEGQVFPIQTLLAATMVQSANDAAQMLAEKIGGSGEAFADMMNDRARALGMTHSRFVDPHGLPNPKDPTNINTASARDLALLGMELMKYPLMREYAKTATMPFANGTFTAGLTNPNHLINPHKQDYMADATGIKTGYSGPAGYCVTASAKRGEMELVSVIMGARANHGPLSSFGLASRLMNESFAQYRRVAVIKKGQNVGSAAVTDGQAKTVPAIAAADAFALVKRGEEQSVKTAFSGGAVAAPVRAGQPVGAVSVTQNGQSIARVPAVAGSAIEKQPWWRKFWPF